MPNLQNNENIDHTHPPQLFARNLKKERTTILRNHTESFNAYNNTQTITERSIIDIKKITFHFQATPFQNNTIERIVGREKDNFPETEFVSRIHLRVAFTLYIYLYHYAYTTSSMVLLGSKIKQAGEPSRAKPANRSITGDLASSTSCLPCLEYTPFVEIALNSQKFSQLEAKSGANCWAASGPSDWCRQNLPLKGALRGRN